MYFLKNVMIIAPNMYMPVSILELGTASEVSLIQTNCEN